LAPQRECAHQKRHAEIEVVAQKRRETLVTLACERAATPHWKPPFNSRPVYCNHEFLAPTDLLAASRLSPERIAFDLGKLGANTLAAVAFALQPSALKAN
jgi:hypothetical protein